MRRLAVFLVVAVVLAGCSSSGESSAPPSTTTTTKARGCTTPAPQNLERIDLTVGRKSRTALVHTPAGWDGKKALPVVLSFHGLGSNAEQQRTADGFVARSDADEFIVVHPQAGGELGALGAAWELEGTSEVDYVDALLDDLERRVCVDLRRVYSTGLSYGGAMTDLVACEMSDRIAAAAPVSAFRPKIPCTPSRPVPMMSFHGIEDALLPYEGGGNASQVAFETWGDQWAKRNGCKRGPQESQFEPTVEELEYSGCKQPVDLYRVHENGHTWPGSPANLPRQVLIDFVSGKITGEPFPLMVVLGLTPEEFADTILLANQDIDATDMILSFFEEHTLGDAPKG